MRFRLFPEALCFLFQVKCFRSGLLFCQRFGVFEWDMLLSFLLSATNGI